VAICGKSGAVRPGGPKTGRDHWCQTVSFVQFRGGLAGTRTGQARCRDRALRGTGAPESPALDLGLLPARGTSELSPVRAARRAAAVRVGGPSGGRGRFAESHVFRALATALVFVCSIRAAVDAARRRQWLPPASRTHQRRTVDLLRVSRSPTPHTPPSLLLASARTGAAASDRPPQPWGRPRGRAVATMPP